VEYLFRLHEQLTAPLVAAAQPARKGRKAQASGAAPAIAQRWHEGSPGASARGNKAGRASSVASATPGPLRGAWRHLSLLRSMVFLPAEHVGQHAFAFLPN
jgi:hypothetical protein